MPTEHGFDWFQLVIFLIGFTIVGFPVHRIVQRAGYNGWWVLAAFVPLLNLFMLWIFAFADWPNVKRSET